MSNGSEHLDERCVHAVDGPDWAGLREPASWKERAIELEAKNEELRAQRDEWRARARRRLITISSLTARLEALEARAVHAELEWSEVAAENVQMRGDLSENRRALDDAINVANSNKIARDALQACLDAMTVEWGTEAVDVDERTIDHYRWADEAEARAVANEHGDTLISRLVGPWTVVPEGEAR